MFIARGSRRRWLDHVKKGVCIVYSLRSEIESSTD